MSTVERIIYSQDVDQNLVDEIVQRKKLAPSAPISGDANLDKEIKKQKKVGTYYYVKLANKPIYEGNWFTESEISDRDAIEQYNEMLAAAGAPQTKRLVSPSPEESLSGFPVLPPTVIAQVPLVTDAQIRALPVQVYNFSELFDIAATSSEVKDASGDTVITTTFGEIRFITPEILLAKIQDDSFLINIQQNLLELYKKKLARYQYLFQTAYDPSSVTADKKDKKESGDQDEFSIKPVLADMVKLAGDKIASGLDLATLRANLTDAIVDRKNGIMSLSGDARREMRNFLANQIYVLSKSIAPFYENFLNIALTGPAGTGKSKMAGTLAFVYGKSGILLKNYPSNIIVGSAKDLVSQFQGGTVNKVNKFMSKGLESVLFIDEAYGIMSCKSNEELAQEQGYGPEAITEIVNFLDVYKGLTVMVVAGYEKAMKNCFFDANQGMN